MAVVNLTEKEKTELSERYDANKRTFERSLSRDLIAFFALLSVDLFASIAATGLPININDYQQELAAILKKNYRKTGAFFSSHLSRLMKEVEPDSPEHEELIKEVQDERTKIEAAVLLLLIPFYNNQAREQAGFILRTTEKIIRDEQIKVLTEEALSEAVMSPAEIAKEIAKKVNKRNRNRVPGISADQVGDIAQLAKQVESEEIVKASRSAGIALDPRKTWKTVGDSRVRKAHSRANGQMRGLNELYVVGGELLEYPKDRRHGASLKNTIQCRCDSVTEI